MRDEDSDAAIFDKRLLQFAAAGGVDVVGRLVEHEKLGLHPESRRHLDLLPLAAAELVEAPGHIVVDMQNGAQAARICGVVACEVEKPIGFRRGFLRAKGE